VRTQVLAICLVLACSESWELVINHHLHRSALGSHAKLILRTTVYARVAYGCCLRHGGKYLWKLAAVTMVPAPIVTGTLMYVFTCLVMCLGGGVMFCFRLSSKQTTKCVARSSAVACNLLAQPC